MSPLVVQILRIQEQLRYLKENAQRAEPGSVEEIIKDIGHLRASVRKVKEDFNRFLRTRTREQQWLIQQLRKNSEDMEALPGEACG